MVIESKKGKYPEKNGIKTNLVSFCAEFNGEQHTQNPTWGNILQLLKFAVIINGRQLAPKGT